MFAHKLQPLLRWGITLRSTSPVGNAATSAAYALSLQNYLEFKSFSSLNKGVPLMNNIGGYPHGPAAFVFDIDGVLLHGREVLPSAIEAVNKLVDRRTGAWRYPVVFMTNGGGTTESKRAEQLSNFLGVRVRTDQVLLAHTPMKGLVHELGDHPVLISGKGDVSNVAKLYGFNKAVHTRQLGAAIPLATPFTKYDGDKSRMNGSNKSVREEGVSGGHPTEKTSSLTSQADLGTETSAFPVMTDPDEWYRDLQLILDVVSGAGVPGRSIAEVPAGTAPVPVYYSAGDLVWANGFPTNRLGQGAFAEMVDHMYKLVHGQSLPYVKFYGKPHPEPYRMAERLLLEQARELNLIPQDHSLFKASDTEFKAVLEAMENSVHLSSKSCSSESSHDSTTIPPLPFSGIFAIGDNPSSDICGANNAGSPWVSILVHTGVFRGPGKNCSKHAAQVAVSNVFHAVEAALHRARNSRWHSMR
eukprot:CAMPEP_0175039940 /NCGR_PEP_ID=MMETSP0052_2-20121109/933_1 /TAXON_ID=51329 ORGANISM="Polytomella parva, Strain SAG 63-3" /NCGR_SAMPLE_ID=MMETSP0052_2 /ASSEMBLY_ACC=CAM_ASM_000194 /LENGTH=470 /DNA_ID=CAMNT_0016301989 /DNA_START=57 /DNA_END=1468 /DNA_ORIENTATION=+